MNAGFFPEEGKYNRTACTRCYTQYSLTEATRYNWRCPDDGGIIKKGVSDRVKELSDGSEARPRPPYTHVIPLAQIIQTMENASSPNTKKCKAIYSSFISTFGNEIAVLIDAPVAEIRTIHAKVADAIDSPADRDRNPHPRRRRESTVRSRSSDGPFASYGDSAGILS